MDTTADITRDNAGSDASSRDAIASSDTSEHLENAPVRHMNQRTSERIVEHLDFFLGHAGRASSEAGHSGNDSISQERRFRRTVSRVSNTRAHTSASTNTENPSAYVSTNAERHSAGLGSIQESEASSSDEPENRSINSLRYPPQRRSRLPRNVYEDLFTSRRPTSPGVPSSTNTNLPNPNRAHGTQGQGAMNQMFPTQNVSTSRPTQGSELEPPRRSRRRRRHLHAQSADNATPLYNELFGQNPLNIRRHTRRTEDLELQQNRRDHGSELGGFSRADTPPASHGGASRIPNLNLAAFRNDEVANQNYAMALYSESRRREIDREINDEILQRRLLGSNAAYANATFLNEARYGRLQNNQPAPKGLDNKMDGRPEAKEAKDLLVNLECRACMSQLVDTVLLPCGHAVLCRWCADQHMPRQGPAETHCPLCRKTISQKFRIFFS